MIIGHQPHVLQYFEYYVAKNGHKRLIYYSLGNWNTGIKSLYK
jgi:poly-gamma-glutamate capsule biosynthesis protein CapA/YwtB (metallophosphatase superfamily)